LLPVLYLLALGVLVDHGDGIFIVWPDALGWAAALVLNYYLLTRLEELQWKQAFYLASYTGYVFLIVSMLSLELDARLFDLASDLGGSFHAVLAVIPLFTVWWARQGRAAFFQRFGLPLQQSISAVMIGCLALWSIGSNLFNSGDAHPLPFMPLLNPLDIAHLVLFIAMIRSLCLVKEQPPEVRHLLQGGIGVLVFVWISALLLRAMHHYKAVPFDLDQMMLDAGVQTGLSILWTLLGMGIILFASRRSMRTLWLVGAALVAVVLVKLVFADLRASGTLERIISFLVVGGLLTAMGYFSPLPPKRGIETESSVEPRSGEQDG
jgi:uncharacterized membrane protein